MPKITELRDDIAELDMIIDETRKIVNSRSLDDKEKVSQIKGWLK